MCGCRLHMSDIATYHFINACCIYPHAVSGENATVCCTNGETYPSLCELLQDTGNEGVAYAGECDREECEGGEVSTPSQKHTAT